MHPVTDAIQFISCKQISVALEDMDCAIEINETANTVINADNEEDLQFFLNKITDKGKASDLKANVKKAEYMVISRNSTQRAALYFDDKSTEKVKTLKILDR